MSLPSCFDCGRIELPACLFTDYLSKMQGSSKLRGSKNSLKKNRKAVNVCTSYSARKLQKDYDSSSPKQDFSKQRKDKQNYQFQDLKRSFSGKRMEVINEEQNECESNLENDGSFDSVAGKNFQDSCADFLSIVHDTVVDSVRSCVDNNLHDYFCQSIEKMEAMYSQMMRNECLLSKMYLDLVERLQRISDKNHKQCEAIYKMISQVNDTLDNGSVDEKERGMESSDKQAAMNVLKAELLNSLPQLPIMDQSQLLQMSMKPGNDMQGSNYMNGIQNMAGMASGIGLGGAMSNLKMDPNMCGNMTRASYRGSVNANSAMGNNMNMNMNMMPNLEGSMNSNMKRSPCISSPSAFTGYVGMQQMGPSTSGYGNPYVQFMMQPNNNEYGNYGVPPNFLNSGTARQESSGGKCKGAENENECSCCIEMQKILQCQKLKSQLAASKATQDAENANQNELQLTPSQLAALNAQNNLNSNGSGNSNGTANGNGNRSPSRISLKSIYDESDGTQTERSIMDTEPIRRPIRPPSTSSPSRRS